MSMPSLMGRENRALGPGIVAHSPHRESLYRQRRRSTRVSWVVRHRSVVWANADTRPTEPVRRRTRNSGQLPEQIGALIQINHERRRQGMIARGITVDVFNREVVRTRS